jgi:hypothetical protein
MSVKDHEDYIEEVQCFMMAVVHPHHCKVRAQTVMLEDDIVLDSGSPAHLFRKSDEIDNYVSFGSSLLEVKLPNGQIILCYGYGSVGILKKVYHVPSITRNLLSVQALAKEGCRITFADKSVYIERGDSSLDFPPILIHKSGGLYILPMNQLHAMSNMTNDEYLSLFVFMMGRPVSADKRILTDEVSVTNELVLDSGCSQHMFNSCRNLTNFIAYAPNQKCNCSKWNKRSSGRIWTAWNTKKSLLCATTIS